jgi:hypothetical protein
VLCAASHGTEAISVLRHDYASAHFAYAVDGAIITAFEPGYPVEDFMYGSDPRRLSGPRRKFVGGYAAAGSGWVSWVARRLRSSSRSFLV